MRYDPFEQLVAPARSTSSLRLLIGGAVLVVLGCWLLSYLFWFFLCALLPNEFCDALLSLMNDTRSPAGVILNLCFFSLLSAALAVSLRVFHQRNLMSLVGPISPSLSQFRRVLIALILFFAITLLIPLPDELSPGENLAFGWWLGLLPLTLLGLFIQTSAEELVFRGYLQSQLAARFSAPFIWIGVPSICFGLLHFDPSLPLENALVIVLWAMFFGFAAADLTARSGTLGPAIALHLVNNFSAIAIAAPEGAFDGLALYTFPFSLASSETLIAWAPIDLMILFCSWLAARVALRR